MGLFDHWSPVQGQAQDRSSEIVLLSGFHSILKFYLLREQLKNYLKSWNFRSTHFSLHPASWLCHLPDVLGDADMDGPGPVPLEISGSRGGDACVSEYF